MASVTESALLASAPPSTVPAPPILNPVSGPGQPPTTSDGEPLRQGRTAAEKARKDIKEIFEAGGPRLSFDSSVLGGLASVGPSVMKSIIERAEGAYETYQTAEYETSQAPGNGFNFFRYGWAGDESARNLVGHYGGVEPPEFTAPFAGATSSERKLTKKGVVQGAGAAHLNYDNPRGQAGGKLKQVGAWSPDISISYPARKDAVYNLQLLNAISQEFLNVITKSVEVEAMVVGDRVAISANKPSTVASIQRQALDKLIEGLITDGPSNRV